MIKKHFLTFISALLATVFCIVAVFAAADYDSTADPLIARSYLIKYINDNVIVPNDAKIDSLEKKLAAIEALINSLEDGNGSEEGGEGEGSEGGGSSSTNDSTLSTILQILTDIAELEQSVNTLNTTIDSMKLDYSALEDENKSLKAGIEDIKQQIADIVNGDGLADIRELEDKYNSLLSEVTALKSTTGSIQSSFTNISKSYVELQREVYNLNQTLKELSVTDSSVLTDLLNLSSKVSDMGLQLNEMINKNMTFELVHLEKGESIIANGSVSVMIQYGDATVSSPASQYGTSMEYTDLTSGNTLKDGDRIPLNHNVFIPGNGRTGVICTGEFGIYIFVGGDYTIVRNEPETPPIDGSDTTEPPEAPEDPEGNGAGGEATGE